MRLLNVHTFELETFFDNIPQYATLSHCWEDEEVVFSDLDDLEQARKKKGFAKVQKICELASEDGFEYAWIDTCCIDKSSSAELSEAINSMFAWYKNCGRCYGFLTDVEFEGAFTEITVTEQFNILSTSKWFTRAWTLQELLAPRDSVWSRASGMYFYSRDWRLLGNKTTLTEVISIITRVPFRYLLGDALGTASISMRMSWAAGRQATRGEDIAYSLLGIFDVSMPLLYGEGKTKAFWRLQEEIMKLSEDETLFAWRKTHPFSDSHVFANEPNDFIEAGRLMPFESEFSPPPYTMTHRGLRISLPLFSGRQLDERGLTALQPLCSESQIRWDVDVTWGVLRCHILDDYRYIVVIPLQCLSPNVFFRDHSLEVSLIPEDLLPDTTYTHEIYIKRGTTHDDRDSVKRRFGFFFQNVPANAYIRSLTPEVVMSSFERIVYGKPGSGSWEASIELVCPQLVNGWTQADDLVIPLTLGCTSILNLQTGAKAPRPWCRIGDYGPSIVRYNHDHVSSEALIASGLKVKATITSRKVLMQDMFVVDIEIGNLY
ncbi:hypothetical protein AA0113_g4585 [Alternaria arborescens]|uniref:Uncharacterized protein n=1 Tax=Alternaria arborescens TaxID=156630 RepID=A0A4Q4SBE0_9PLEO|nr:hypothetical protein AA0113_g4585 [Alternaria arborescens]